ncbi:MAG: DUF6141 family protein [Chloroflexota bacterium]
MTDPIVSSNSQSPDTVLYHETQPYRELPPVLLLVVVSAIAGWGLLIWTVIMGRPLGQLELPTWLGIVLGLGFGVAIPALFLWTRMETFVYPDRVTINTGLSGKHTFDYDHVVAVEMRDSNLRDDYSNRTVGTKENTRIAYAVNSLQGTQLILGDGQFVLIGSKKPEELTKAIDAAWQVDTISNVT